MTDARVVGSELSKPRFALHEVASRSSHSKAYLHQGNLLMFSFVLTAFRAGVPKLSGCVYVLFCLQEMDLDLWFPDNTNVFWMADNSWEGVVRLEHNR